MAIVLRMTCTAPKSPCLVLGTAQIGLPYGAANITGLPKIPDAIVLIRAAVAAGVRVLDTARAYGDAERRIGAALAGRDDVEVVTKLDTLADVRPDAAPREAIAAARASLEASRAALRYDGLRTLLLHRGAHRTAWDGAIWDLLREEQARGTIGRLGVSVQFPSELAAALNDPAVTHVQLPFNVLDYRWQVAGLLSRLRTRPDVTVHVRSVYLQGLLAAPAAARWPPIDGTNPAELTDRLGRAARRFGRNSIADLALAFVRAQDWIDGIVIGMETRAQLDANLAAFATPPLASEACVVIERRARVPERLLDPAQWPGKPAETTAT